MDLFDNCFNQHYFDLSLLKIVLMFKSDKTWGPPLSALLKLGIPILTRDLLIIL